MYLDATDGRAILERSSPGIEITVVAIAIQANLCRLYPGNDGIAQAAALPKEGSGRRINDDNHMAFAVGQRLTEVNCGFHQSIGVAADGEDGRKYLLAGRSGGGVLPTVVVKVDIGAPVFGCD